MATSRIPRYDVRNDGVGPYAVFYCEMCDREYRSSPDIASNVAQDFGKQALGGFLRGVPLVGRAAADSVVGQDRRYVQNLTPQELQSHWAQVEKNFRECPTCKRIICLSQWDNQSGYCQEDSPRKNEIARAEAEQAGNIVRGFADALGITDAMKTASQAAKQAASSTARCPKDGTIAAAGTKFCPECGAAMVQPQADACPKCGAATMGAKFCPQCGTKIERAAAPTNCKSCGAALNGAKFCPECGAKAV